jgi:type I restriction-modification system DNA methylase subunit
MTQLENIESIEKRLWKGADTLRANSNLASNEYFMPVMGLIFLRHAYSRFLKVKSEIEASLPSRGGQTRPVTNDFIRKLIKGLVKVVSRKDIEDNDYSLTPGRYVGVAAEEVDEDFDFEETLKDIHIELSGLNEEAVELAAQIAKNFEELGV